MENKSEMISNGVGTTYIHGGKFKKSIISISFFVPLNEKDSPKYALLSGLLTRGTAKYNNYTLLNARLKELYGASVSSSTGANGDMQYISFTATCLNDRFTEGEHLLSEVAALLCEMLFSPIMENGLFKADDFESEKRLLCEDVLADMNDKRRYALQKMSAVLYKGEPCGLPVKGTIESAKAITNEQAVEAYKKMLEAAYVYVTLVSDENHPEIFKTIADKFNSITREPLDCDITVKHTPFESTKTVEEKMDVTQGKLCMGFSVKCGDSLYDIAVLRILTDIFGGGTYSKLFGNVREKQSLCYYCAARPSETKSAIVVESGILDENRQKAQESILHELDDIKNGGVDEELLNTSKKSMCDLLTTACDSIYSVNGWYSARPFVKDFKIESLIDEIGKVKLCDVLDMAKTVKLDAVYYLGSDKTGE